MIGGSGRIDVLEVLYHTRLDEGWTTLERVLIDFQRMGKRPRRERVAQHLTKLIESGWLEWGLTFGDIQVRLVREKKRLLNALDAEADKQQLVQIALASEVAAPALRR
jgi:hypothetical protein